MEFTFTLKNIREVASQFVSLIKEYHIITFRGEMGAGKTTFIKEVCKVLGVNEMVSSPSFALIQEYRSKENNIIYHIDLYRIKNEAEAMEAGIEDCIAGNELCMVEWPEKAPDLFPEGTVCASLFIISGEQRKLMVELPQ